MLRMRQQGPQQPRMPEASTGRGRSRQLAAGKLAGPAWRKHAYNRLHAANGHTFASSIAALAAASHSSHSSPIAQSSSSPPLQGTDPAAPAPPLELHGVRSAPARLFKLRGHFAGHTATILLDSGASSEFIDPEFARRCGLALTPSSRSVKLADGTLVAARGQVTSACELDATKGAPLTFTSTYTVTPLEGYLSLIHISEPTRRTPISYAVFC